MDVMSLESSQSQQGVKDLAARSWRTQFMLLENHCIIVELMSKKWTLITQILQAHHGQIIVLLKVV
jgi:hypothetical protein